MITSTDLVTTTAVRRPQNQDDPPTSSQRPSHPDQPIYESAHPPATLSGSLCQPEEGMVPPAPQQPQQPPQLVILAWDRSPMPWGGVQRSYLEALSQAEPERADAEASKSRRPTTHWTAPWITGWTASQTSSGSSSDTASDRRPPRKDVSRSAGYSGKLALFLLWTLWRLCVIGLFLQGVEAAPITTTKTEMMLTTSLLPSEDVDLTTAPGTAPETAAAWMDGPLSPGVFLPAVTTPSAPVGLSDRYGWLNQAGVMSNIVLLTLAVVVIVAGVYVKRPCGWRTTTTTTKTAAAAAVQDPLQDPPPSPPPSPPPRLPPRPHRPLSSPLPSPLPSPPLPALRPLPLLPPLIRPHPLDALIPLPHLPAEKGSVIVDHTRNAGLGDPGQTEETTTRTTTTTTTRPPEEMPDEPFPKTWCLWRVALMRATRQHQQRVHRLQVQDRDRWMETAPD